MSFIIVLGAVIFILCAVGICLLIRQPVETQKNSNRFKPVSSTKKVKQKKEKVNRYQKIKKTRGQPRLGSTPFNMPDNNAADEVLGIKKPVEKDQPVEAKPRQFRIDSIAAEKRIIVFYVRADEGKPYMGYELLQTLLSSGLRFGDMSIFHHTDGFSVASITPPGTFDLDEMGSYSCTGLSLFLSLENATDPMKAFQSMLNVSDQLVQALGGQVLDEGQVMLSKEKVLELHRELQSAYV